VIAGRENEGKGCESRRSAVSAVARVRNEGEDFDRSFEELKGLVAAACEGQREWEAKVVAVVRVVGEFAAASPGKGLALTVEARRPRADGRAAADEVIAYFAELLAEVAPNERRAPISTDASIVEAIALIVRGHLIAGTADQLPETAPDLVYLALVPYLGMAETRGWSKALALGGP